MRDAVANTLTGIAVVIAALLVLWAFQGNDFFMYKFFAPRYEAARRTVFEETPSYVQGKQQFLTRLHHEWVTSDSQNHRDATCALARHEASTLKPEYLPNNLKAWECVR